MDGEERYVFRSALFEGVVDEACAFFTSTPINTLPPELHFTGSGVYGLYYCGDFEHYNPIVENNGDGTLIYIGKAVPPGWRTARNQSTDRPVLYQRLREHNRSIEQCQNLNIRDFKCRFIILRDRESDLISPLEAELIRRHTPIWNSLVDGFGNHDPGSGRYGQARSEWDVLHPGRAWANRLRGESPTLESVIDKLTHL